MWLSSCFLNQRSAVRVQSSARLYIAHLFTVNCIEKTKVKRKRCRELGPFKKDFTDDSDEFDDNGV